MTKVTTQTVMSSVTSVAGLDVVNDFLYQSLIVKEGITAMLITLHFDFWSEGFVRQIPKLPTRYLRVCMLEILKKDMFHVTYA